MESVSVIITAHNNAAVLPRTLRSAHEAITFAREAGGPMGAVEAGGWVGGGGPTDRPPGVPREFRGTPPPPRGVPRGRGPRPRLRPQPGCRRRGGPPAALPRGGGPFPAPPRPASVTGVAGA